ncbi:MAG TPA: hypothetical protein VNE38_07030 [Ktedonobacteraceae bacterium]|nr:hypothetical protein [Ktedonobacteraceae bacterium]
MSIVQTTSEGVLPDYDACPGCGVTLPHGAVFCASCGERLDRTKDLTALLKDEQDISSCYRITSLVRRRPYVNLYLAFDTRPTARGRMVTMRDIDLTSLEDEQARLRVIELVQQEYDLLRLWRPPHVMPAIDLRYARGHLYTVAGFPPQTGAGESEEAGWNREVEEKKENWPRLMTLQDYLQSGQGLPGEKRALQMMSYLCEAVDNLHQHQVVIGDLDPYTVILNGETVDAQSDLMISWLLPGARAMLPPPKLATPPLSYFIAPESLHGKADARSDIYSLGAIFYLLLTGMPPEESALRYRTRLRTPLEAHVRIAANVSESVMGALALDPAERFQSVAAFSEALRDPRYRHPVSQRKSETSGEQAPDVETVRIVPLSHRDVARWRAGRPGFDVPETPPIASSKPPASEKVDDTREEEQQEEEEERPQARQAAPVLSLMKRVTGVLPAIKLDAFKPRPVVPVTPHVQKTENGARPASQGANAWFERIKRMVLGQQQHAIAAAAIIETPLRVLPDQQYTIRLHIMGRDDDRPSNKARQGLSALVHGDIALIEVRSVLQQSYAYIVQQATVIIPAQGYVAEVTIPMQPLSSTPTGRRDRLHIFMLDEQRHPLYEKPFVLEIFVSHHVKPGGEGHHVLTIPV